MAHELHGYVVGNVPLRERDYFLDKVICPIYNVLYKVIISFFILSCEFWSKIIAYDEDKYDIIFYILLPFFCV
jgi:hypothetical protein